MGRLTQENFYKSTEMALFDNELTLDIRDVKQDQYSVLSPLNAISLLIYTNGSLFQHLTKYNTNVKDCTDLLVQAPPPPQAERMGYIFLVSVL